MILLIEMQCKDWEHNRVNAGIVELCRLCVPQQRLKLYAQEAHAAGVCRLLHAGETLQTEAIEFPDCRADSEQHVKLYQELLEAMVRDEDSVETTDRVETVILLSCNKGIIRAVSKVSRIMPDKKFYVILHAALEEVCAEKWRKTGIGGVLRWIKRNVHRFMNGLRYGAVPSSMSVCLNRCKAENCYFIIYTPCYREALEGKIKPAVLRKFIFLHHPLYEPDERKKAKKKPYLEIGIYGQAVNQNAYDIVDRYNQKYENGSVRFRIMTRADHPILKLPNTSRMFATDYVDNEQLAAAIQELDYVLIPYGKGQYQVTASGIFCDAVSLEVPALLLDSPLFLFYQKYGMGILEEDVEAMARRIAVLHDADTQKYRAAAHAMKTKLTAENVRTFRERVCG